MRQSTNVIGYNTTTSSQQIEIQPPFVRFAADLLWSLLHNKSYKWSLDLSSVYIPVDRSFQRQVFESQNKTHQENRKCWLQITISRQKLKSTGNAFRLMRMPPQGRFSLSSVVSRHRTVSPGQWVIWVTFHVRVTGSSFWPDVRPEFFQFWKNCPKCKTYNWNGEMTKVLVRCLLLDWNHRMSVHAINF